MPCTAARPRTISSTTPAAAEHDTGGDDRDVFEQHSERDEHDAERRQRVEAGERRGEERGERACADEHPEQGIARPVVEEQPSPWSRETLETADQAQQSLGEALPPRPGELDPAPPLRQPDAVAPGDELEREHDRDELEDVCRPAGGQGERRHPEQQDEDEREAVASEDVDEPTERGLTLAVEKALEVVAD